MTRYELFKQMAALCSMEKIGENQYNKMIQSGRPADTHYDYGRGYYDIYIFYIFSRNAHWCRVWFGTIDNGDYGCFIEKDTKEEAIKLIEDIRDIFKGMSSLPAHDKLNLLFRDLGVYFSHE